MKTKIAALIAVASFVASGVSFGTVTINFNNAFAGGVSSNLANSAGQPTDNLNWGIIIDTSGNGFLNEYAPLSGPFTFNSRHSLFNSTNTLTDNILVFGSSFTTNTSGFLEGDFTTPGGSGGITAIVDLALTGGIAAGNAFQVVWFNTGFGGAGLVGTLNDPSFTLPPDGNTVDRDAPFVGVDPIRSAGLGYTGTAAASSGPGVSFVPEPSSLLLGAVGALGLLRRRRI